MSVNMSLSMTMGTSVSMGGSGRGWMARLLIEDR